jgi:hypothetical protein
MRAGEAARARPSRRALCIAAPCLVLSVVVGCTDGVTPDCSDAAVCAPSQDLRASDASIDGTADVIDIDGGNEADAAQDSALGG